MLPAFLGQAFAPAAQNGKRGDFSPDLYGFLRAFVGVKIETLYNNAHPPHVGCFCLGMGRVDVGIDPYDVEYKFHECARRLQNRTISCAGNIAVQVNI